MSISVETLLKKVLRPHIQAIVPYSTARDEFDGEAEIFLDANENPYGSITETPFNRYPDPYQKEVKEKLAKIKKVRPAQIFLGNGSDEGIDLLIRMSCEPKRDNILIMPPTYGMYQVSADINNVSAIKVPLKSDFQIDQDLVLDVITPDTKIIWLCSPNNPSGNLLDRKVILHILNHFDGLVVVDEAYIDFSSEESWTQKLDEFPNLVVLQTFSKAWGLANLRLGMVFANEAIINVLNKIKAPYNISGITQKLLNDSLKDEKYKNEMVDKILTQRKIVSENLQKLSIVKKIYPSDSNFLLVKFENAEKVFHYLIDKKIIVRDRSKVKLCEGCLRITIGTELENENLINTLKDLD